MSEQAKGFGTRVEIDGFGIVRCEGAVIGIEIKPIALVESGCHVVGIVNKWPEAYRKAPEPIEVAAVGKPVNWIPALILAAVVWAFVVAFGG
jgi:hypothetical protein